MMHHVYSDFYFIFDSPSFIGLVGFHRILLNMTTIPYFRSDFKHFSTTLFTVKGAASYIV